jgi:uncharacterized membrane protein (UPF0127 family)
MAAHFLRQLLTTDARSCRLVNVTRSIVIATEIELAGDSAARRHGLLGRDRLTPDAALVIAPSNAIHMFGMRFAIDVLFARRDGLVVKRVLRLRPRRLAFAWRAFAAIELCANHPAAAATSVGDYLKIE